MPSGKSRFIRFTAALLAAGVLPAAADPAPGPDLAREQRLAEQTVAAISDGEPIYLEAAGRRFLGIHMEAETGESRRAAPR